MSDWERICYKLLNLSLSMLVRSKSIPEKPTMELELNISSPIVYVLPHYSKIDLLIFRIQCLKDDLPDPLEPLKIDGILLPRYIFIQDQKYIFTYYASEEKSTKLLNKYLDLHRSNPNLDVQIMLISVIFDHHPNYQKSKKNLLIRILNNIKTLLIAPWSSCNSFIRFFPPVSLRQITDEYSNDKIIVQKLIRVARMHFSRYHLAVVGPQLPSRKDLFEKLLTSKAIIRAVEDEARNKKISYKKAKRNAIAIIEEIAAKFSYKMIRLSEFILSFIWNRFYQKINVHNVKNIRQLAYDGHNIVYIPCHRSHMDYLLLSFVLYHQGLVPPHIAAGINLNFWPAGMIFRRLGAFFIRRTFKSNKLYSTIFREYLGELFCYGCSIEYFIEGTRSRTGRLLGPKTGTLSMTVQAILRRSTRPVTLVPVYIGYEQIMEIDTYEKELRGENKKKENLFQILRSLVKLHNLGQSYVNFGKPIQLISWLNQHIPRWYESINPTKVTHPSWLTPAVNNIASELMIRINNASSVNAMNLCCTALLASSRYSLTRRQLTEQLECYLAIMRNASYSDESTVPSTTATKLIDYILQTDKFKVEKSNTGDIIIIIPRKQAILMTYYRNNIAHMLILPSIIATILIHHQWITQHELLRYIKVLYPMLKSELFLGWNKDELESRLDKLTNELLRQDLLIIKNNEINSNPSRSYILKLLASSASEILQRYAITFWLLNKNPLIDNLFLQRESYILVQRLTLLHNNTLDFFDREVFRSLFPMLRNEGYINNTGHSETYKVLKVYKMLAGIISPDIRLAIERITSISTDREKL